MAALADEQPPPADVEEVEPSPEELEEDHGEEDLEQLAARQAREVAALERLCRVRLQKAKAAGGKAVKKRLAAVRASNDQDEDNLRYRHGQELDELDEEEGSEEEDATAAAAAAAAEAAAKAKAEEDERARISRKKGKAQRKKDKKAEEAREREKQKEAEKAGVVSERQVELDAINRQLGTARPEPLATHEVLSDGHCLFRAVEHQLRSRGLALDGDALGTTAAGGGGGGGGGVGFQDLRRRTAEYMRQHADDFVPFLMLTLEPAAGGDVGAAFRDYCDRMASTADWGGQTELQALAQLLRLPLQVFSADAPPLLMGEEFAADAAPLQLTFHRQYYALGEHYNSTVPKALAQSEP